MNIEVITPPPVEPVTLAEVWAFLRIDPYPAVEAVEADPMADPPIVAVDAAPAFSDFDAQLIRHIRAARERVETYTRRALVHQKLRLTVGGLPREPFLAWSRWGGFDGYESRPSYIELLRPPLISLDSVSYWNDANVSTVLFDSTIDPPVDPALVYVSNASVVPRLEFSEAFDALQACTYRRDDAVSVEYTAGFPFTPATYVDPDADPLVELTPADYTSQIPASLIDAVLIDVQLRFDILQAADRQALEDAFVNSCAPYRVRNL